MPVFMQSSTPPSLDPHYSIGTTFDAYVVVPDGSLEDYKDKWQMDMGPDPLHTVYWYTYNYLPKEGDWFSPSYDY